MSQEKVGINFKADEMLSFHYLWFSSMSENGGATQKCLDGFEDKQIFELLETSVFSYGSDAFLHIKSMEAAINNNEIKDINDFVSMAEQKFPEKQEAFREHLPRAFEAYHDFFSKALPEMQDMRSSHQKFQTDEKIGYDKELTSLYAFYGVEPKPINCFLHPYPTTPLLDGMASEMSTHVGFALQKREGEKYYDNSNIMMKKASTPLHEASHFLFSIGGMRDDYKKGNTPGMSSLHQYLCDYLTKNPTHKLSPGAAVESNAVFALDEGLAACAGMMLREKIDGEIKPDAVWYHGFEAANRLAPAIYPLFKEYMGENKKMDDVFFSRLHKRMSHNEKIASIKEKITSLVAAKNGVEQDVVEKPNMQRERKIDVKSLGSSSFGKEQAVYD